MDTAIQIWLATAPNAAVAESIARQLVEAQVAACVNIVPKITSIYRWQGKVENADECLLIIKAPTTNAARLKSTYKSAHPYEVPELIAVDVADGLPDYLKWALESRSPA